MGNLNDTIHGTTAARSAGGWTATRVSVWVDRTAAWLSALLLFLYVVSGFGMTKPDFVSHATAGLVTWRVAYDLHNALSVPLIALFTLHTASGLRRALLRTTKRRRVSVWLAIALGGVLLAYLLAIAYAPSIL